MVNHIKAFEDAIKYQHEIEGTPRVLMETNWNTTKFLIDDGSYPVVDTTDLLAGSTVKYWKVSTSNRTGMNPSKFAAMFTTTPFSQFNHNSANWSPVLNALPIPQTIDFAVEQEFFIEIGESGLWQFYVSCDDVHEFIINNRVITANYDLREATIPPAYQNNGGYIFDKPGRYAAKVRFYNAAGPYSFYLGFKSPTMQENSDPAAAWPVGKMFVPPADNIEKIENPELIKNYFETVAGYPMDTTANYNANTDIKSWSKWKENFPLGSITGSHRPESGINYNMLVPQKDSAYIMNNTSFVEYENEPRKKRYYLLQRNDQSYKYWLSDALSSNTVNANFAGEYNIPYVTLLLKYTEPVSSNMINFTFNLGPLPKRASIQYLDDTDTWRNVISSGSTIAPNANTGALTFYRKSSNAGTEQGNWTTDESSVDFRVDESVMIKQIRIKIFTVDKPNRRLEMIEMSARKKLDVTSRTIGFEANLSMDEADFTRILGTVSSNSGSIQLSNWDLAFGALNTDVGNSETPKLGQLTERQTKVTIDLMYNLKEQGYNDPYPVRMATFYSADWSREGEYDYTLNLFDSGKILQNVTCPEIFEKNIPVHALVAQILDSIGFSRYRIDTDDYRNTSSVLPYYSTKSSDQKVWEVLQDICKTTLSVVYFDEYGVLQLVTKDQLTDAPDIKELPPGFTVQANPYVANVDSIYYGLGDVEYSLGSQITPNPRSVSVRFNDGYYVEHPTGSVKLYRFSRVGGPQRIGAWQKFDLKVLRGEKDTGSYSPIGDRANDPNALPNMIQLGKKYDIEANDVSIKYKPKEQRRNQDPLNDYLLTDIVWRSNETITLRGTRLAYPMYPWEQKEFWIFPEEAKTWPFKGRANVNGEIIAWEGKEYEYFETVIDSRGVTTILPAKRTMIFSVEEQFKLDKLAGTTEVAVNRNRYTGRMQLLRDLPRREINSPDLGPLSVPQNVYLPYDNDQKVNKPKGRGRDQDPSKYEVDHPTNRRPGWNPYRMTVGATGAQAGTWAGEESTSFYTPLTWDHSTTSIESNRPNNGNADWFRNQTLCRTDTTTGVWDTEYIANTYPQDFGLPRKLQQWGFRFKFKDSTTHGEINLMFNMAQVAGNRDTILSTNPALVNQMYQITFLESQNLVRDATNEIGAWTLTPYPFDGSADLKLGNSAQRLVNRNGWESRADRMKGYRYNFERDKWYDVKVDLTRGRGYGPNADMHFFVWVNGEPVGGFTCFNQGGAQGPGGPWLPRTNTWGIGHRAASKVEIENAYSWTEFAEVKFEDNETRYDLTSGQYVSTYLENGLLLPSPGAAAPYRDGGPMDGNFFFDDFGSLLHEIRDFDVKLDKGPVEGVSGLASNQGVRFMDISTSPSHAKFSVVNITGKDLLAHGREEMAGGNGIDHQLALFGYVLEEKDETTLNREDRNAIRDRGRVQMDIDANWISEENQAQELADWVVQHFSDPKDVLDVEYFGDASIAIGDKCSIRYKKGDIDKGWVYVVFGVTKTYSSKGLEMRLDLRRMRDRPVLNSELSAPVELPNDPDPIYKPTVPTNPTNPTNPNPGGGSGGGTTTPPITPPKPPEERAVQVRRLTGLDRTGQWDIGGTDLGIPYTLENGSTGYLLGDTFSGAMPGSPGWRSPVMLRSDQARYPLNNGILFDSAAKVPGTSGHAPAIMHNDYNTSKAPGAEWTVIPTDGISFPETGRQIVSYMSVNNWDFGVWRTNYLGLAYSDNGNDFIRLGDDQKWFNDGLGLSPFQQWTMQRDGNYVYIFSVANGRHIPVGMHLMRVHYMKMFNKADYEAWNGTSWVRGGRTKAILSGVFGEPSVRKLGNTWVMAYLSPLAGAIVTRQASSPTGPWSAPKTQVTALMLPNMYGGFIHPKSTVNELHMIVSQWSSTNYAVYQYKGKA